MVMVTWALTIVTAAMAVFTGLLALGAFKSLGLMRKQRAAAQRPLVLFRSDYEAIPVPADKDIKVNFVNIGGGAALNMRAEGVIAGNVHKERAAGIGPLESHPPREWIDALKASPPKAAIRVQIIYQDVELTWYYSKREEGGEWDVGEGYEGLEHLLPKKRRG